ncbi:MAG: UDP-N-acetylglucosamine 2-epimerase (non-hydrolyzing) [Sphingomonas sp.]|nr:UDP-N-acetylglucosamine 2-epimerase (non-hydrolyzing) [Sphingomonas sp.]
MLDRSSLGNIGGPKPGGTLRQSRIALVIGTRPEAIKLSPVAHALAAIGERPRLLVTGQHPGLELADHGLAGFDATPLACPGQTDPAVHADLVRSAAKRVLAFHKPDLLIVQGDTSSALGGALAAKELNVPLAHVEAGLRSFDTSQPWPEEENRVTIDRLADLLFAPTTGNAANLRREGTAGLVFVTGNPGIDTLAAIAGPLPAKKRQRWLRPRTMHLLVTCHRREAWGEGLEHVAETLLALAAEGMTIDVMLHPNPTVTQTIWALLGDRSAIRLIAPLSHGAMVKAMRRADLILSDSGGMQEEAPALGVPLLVLRDKTERPEGLMRGAAELVGTDPARILAAVRRLRQDRAELRRMATPAMPYGDGRAAPRIACHCLAFLANRDSNRQSLRA